jgi:hypothetical protein
MTFMDGGTIINPGGTPVAVDPNSGTASITINLTAPPQQAVAGQAVGAHSITAVFCGTCFSLSITQAVAFRH